MAKAIEEFRGRTPDQLQESLLDLKREQFNLRFQAATGQLEKAHRVDDHARTGGVDRHPALLVRALDQDARDAGLQQALAQELAQLDVLVEQPAVVLPFGEPAAVPGAVDAEPKPDRIDLLTHLKRPRSSRGPRW